MGLIGNGRIEEYDRILLSSPSLRSFFRVDSVL